MAEIAPPRINSISDPNSEPQDHPAKKTRVKPSAGKSVPARAPEISTPDEEDKHELDEMA